MANFLGIYFKTIAFFASVFTILICISFATNFYDNYNKSRFIFFKGDENSSNIVAIINIDGLIIENNNAFNRLSNPKIISPSLVKTYLNELEEISPQLVIFSINSPGGTVSASKEMYDIINNFKKKKNIEIYFHTNELLASGGYWTAIAGNKIFANYGAIIGSIGVRGPDWYFFNKPKSISSGIFGSRIETQESIEIYSNTSGKSKDLLNPFRQPLKNEIEHLQNMVDEIYNDFVKAVSKERKIENKIIINNIGALIYTSKKAFENNLIDEVISLDNLIQKIVDEKKFSNYKIIENLDENNSFFKEIFKSLFNKFEFNNFPDCLTLRSSISAVLNYKSTGC